MTDDYKAVLCFVAAGLVLLISGCGIWSEGQSNGKRLGAKIALSIDSPTDYRASEVRGSCDDLFDTDECVKCHDFEGREE